MQYTEAKHSTLFGEVTETHEDLRPLTSPAAVSTRESLVRLETQWEAKKDQVRATHVERRAALDEREASRKRGAHGIKAAFAVAFFFGIERVVAFAKSAELPSDLACLERLEQMYASVPGFGMMAEALNQCGDALRAADRRLAAAQAALVVADREYGEAYFTLRGQLGVAAACIKVHRMPDAKISLRRRGPGKKPDGATPPSPPVAMVTVPEPVAEVMAE